MLRTALLIYAVLFVAFRVVIFYRNSDACVGDATLVSNGRTQYCLRHSEQFDQQCVMFEGAVIQSGHLWWDIFWISSYAIRTTDGQSITIFTRSAVPTSGILIAAGTFRQFYKGAYFTWLGLVESDRIYTSPSNAPPEKKKTSTFGPVENMDAGEPVESLDL